MSHFTNGFCLNEHSSSPGNDGNLVGLVGCLPGQEQACEVQPELVEGFRALGELLLGDVVHLLVRLPASGVAH